MVTATLSFLSCKKDSSNKLSLGKWELKESIDDTIWVAFPIEHYHSKYYFSGSYFNFLDNNTLERRRIDSTSNVLDSLKYFLNDTKSITFVDKNNDTTVYNIKELTPDSLVLNHNAFLPGAIDVNNWHYLTRN